MVDLNVCLTPLVTTIMHNRSVNIPVTFLGIKIPHRLIEHNLMEIRMETMDTIKALFTSR